MFRIPFIQKHITVLANAISNLRISKSNTSKSIWFFIAPNYITKQKKEISLTENSTFHLGKPIKLMDSVFVRIHHFTL